MKLEAEVLSSLDLQRLACVKPSTCSWLMPGSMDQIRPAGPPHFMAQEPDHDDAILIPAHHLIHSLGNI